jgi:16S rRNA processing protein RimM
LSHPGAKLGERRPNASKGERTAVGRVGRPHGLDGSFYVTRPLARALTLGARVRVGAREAEIVRRAGTDARPLVRLSGIEDRAGAEAARGAELSVPREDMPALGPDEWWAHELEGCTVVDGDRQVGVVERLLELPSCEALEVSLSDAPGTLLVPLVKDAIREIAPQRRRIEIDLDFLEPPPTATPRGRGSTPPKS